MILRHTEVQEPMIISNPFIIQLTKLRLRLPQLLYSVFSPGFHITCSFSYYLYAVGFQIVTSLTFFPKTHSQLLYLVWVLVWVLQVPQIYRYKASIFSSVTHLSKCAFFCTAVQTGSLRILFLTSPSSSFI